jgi:hypothetical protein
MAKKDEILELLNAYKSEVDNFNDAVFTDKFEVLAQDIVKLFAIPVVTTRIYRFSGLCNKEKFNRLITAPNRETAIAYFETENPHLTWRTTTVLD